MNNIKKFVTNLLKDYFNDEDKKELIEIMTTSLEEKVEDLVEEGKSREEAIEESLKDFGSTTDVLQAFPESDKLKENKLKKRKNQLMFASVSYLIITGLVVYLNLAFLPERLWFIFIAIALLFWPLVMYFRYRESRR